MSSYIETYKSKMNWGNVLERAAAVPLDRSSMFSSYNDAVAYAKGDGSDSRGFGATSYIGQVITVYEDDEVNVYVINSERGLDLVGSNLSTIVIDDFSTAQELATNDNIGQLIYTKSTTYVYEDETGNTVYTTDIPETTGYTTYDAGVYIVTGQSNLMKLAQSSATGDISGDLTELQGKVSNLQTLVEEHISVGGNDLI